MSVLHLLQSIFELAVIAFIIWGFFNEDKFVAFEKSICASFRRHRLKVVRNKFVRNVSSEFGIDA